MLPKLELTVYTETELQPLVELICDWENLPYFPKTKQGIRGLAETLLDLIGTPERIGRLRLKYVNNGAMFEYWDKRLERLPDMAQTFTRLIGRMCSRTPTPFEMRRIFCEYERPADGLEAGDYDLNQFLDRRSGGDAVRKAEG